MTPVDDYLAGLAGPERAAFERLRLVVRRLIPDVEEGRSYGMPAFKYKQRPLLGFMASKNHLSLFPFSAAGVDAVRDELAGFDLSKGTIRFTPDKPLPDSSIEHLVRYRQRELDGH